MRKKILAILSVLIIVFSTALIYNVYTDEFGKEDVTGYSDEVTSEDVMSEIDDSLLDEDDAVEIGEMV